MGMRKVLVVDDDPSVLTCYGRLFRRQGYDACLEPNGSAVVKNLESYRDVGVIILDYRMPGMNGLELLKRLRRFKIRAQVILVSGHTNPELVEEAKGLGIRRIFSKPVDMAGLLAAVAESWEEMPGLLTLT